MSHDAREPWWSRLGIGLAERGALPDPLLRRAIRGVVAGRQRDLRAQRIPDQKVFRDELASGPIAVETAAANAQHYEWPPELFVHALGPRLKYSSAHWGPTVTDLADAEERMLALTCERAGIEDGMRVLDLGCGWGSFTLWVAEHYPEARVLAVSNSGPQREFIEARCRELGTDRVSVVTADVNAFSAPRHFDRVVSIEMFEHMRNWALLLERISGWLVPEGRLFLHYFANRRYAYPYEDEGASDWMARHFFSGGIMPSEHLVAEYPAHMSVEQSWRVNGNHYAETCDAWLRNLDEARTELQPVYERVVGRDGTEVAHNRWRMFFIACAELFRYGGGEEWFVAHHRLAPTGAPAR